MRCAVCGQLQALLREQDRHVDREMQLGRLRRVHRVRYITARRATANRAVMMALFIEFPGPPVICRATCLVDSCDQFGLLALLSICSLCPRRCAPARRLRAGRLISSEILICIYHAQYSAAEIAARGAAHTPHTRPARATTPRREWRDQFAQFCS